MKRWGSEDGGGNYTVQQKNDGISPEKPMIKPRSDDQEQDKHLVASAK